MEFVGITERGDAALDDSWKKWVYDKNLPAILITKNAPLLENNYPDILSKNVIIHATCTGLGNSFIEPNVPHYDKILSWIEDKTEEQRKRIVLRVDPICLPLFLCQDVVQYNNKNYFEIIINIFNFAEEYKLRTRISFLDLYPHVISRFDERQDIQKFLMQNYNGDLHLPLEDRKSFVAWINKSWPHLKLEICGEPGLPCDGCVSSIDLNIFGIEYNIDEFSYGNQRKGCCCLALKTELLNNKCQCKHGCLYCYWRN